MDKALVSILSWWESAGVTVPDIKAAPRRKPARPEAISIAETPKAPTKQAVPPPSPASADIAKTAKSLDQLRQSLMDFDAGEISDHARQAVFARGNPDADIMVIGEAPGRDEDIQGKPFVGRSGQLLDKIFAAIGLGEDDLYITNVVNWRPPKNRNPTAQEIAICKPFLLRHIELMDPKYIVLVGGISLSALTDLNGIMKNRGQWTTLSVGGKDIPTLPIYHPAFLLRQPALKKDVWRDMLSLREVQKGKDRSS